MLLELYITGRGKVWYETSIKIFTCFEKKYIRSKSYYYTVFLMYFQVRTKSHVCVCVCVCARVCVCENSDIETICNYIKVQNFIISILQRRKLVVLSHVSYAVHFKKYTHTNL